MNDNMKKLLTRYKSQTDQMFTSYGPSYATLYRNMTSPVLFNAYDPLDKAGEALKHDTGVGTEHDLDNWFDETGLFADCCYENGVISLLTRPVKSIGSLFPVVSNNNTQVTQSLLVGDEDIDGNWPVGVCDIGPNVGQFGNCELTFNKGRVSLSTRTIELDALLEKWCAGYDPSRFFLIGGNRGVSAPLRNDRGDDSNMIFRSAIYRELHGIGNAMNKELLRQFWQGDPTNATAGSGYVPFRGLLDYIVNDYATDPKPWVTDNSGTGLSCDLDADVKEFDACVGAVNADGNTLYQLLEEIELELTQRADNRGLSVDWAVVVTPMMARELARMLPCEMMGNVCGTGTTGVDVVANDNFLLEARRQMQREQMINLNGKFYPIIEDQYLPEAKTDTGTGWEYESDIIFLPIRVNGQAAVQWLYKNYTALDSELAYMGDWGMELRGWSDDGRMHSVVQRDMRCFLIETKTEMGLMFPWSFLSGRINDSKVCLVQEHETLNPAA